ncbi:MAG: hypothetical protein K1X53_07470 [Candidatus Sumerlaeaceae bacterium]|nr:hypothetical protein [Candidatus Sumerlaeaceae bacterium]
MQELLDEQREAVQKQSGHPIDVVEDPTLSVPSKTELAWKHGTDTHRILYRPVAPAIIPHFVLRAIEHIAMESEARATGQNQKFVTTPATREVAIKAIGRDIYKLRDMGIPEAALTDYVLQIIAGLGLQLYNCPLDMVVEYRLYKRFPLIRPHQFVSLRQTQADNLQVVTSKEIKRTTPNLIFAASAAMNYAYALFADQLFGGKTAFAAQYPPGDFRAAGESLFNIWKTAIEDFDTGDEYTLMKQFAETLGLVGWFQLAADVTEATFAGYDPPPTDQELLKQREPATMMHLLGALQRFETMTPEDVKRVASEISIIGMNGITFTDPDKRFTLRTLPGEEFTGLQLLAMMFVGWKQVEPTLNTGLDFEQAFQAALLLHRRT